MNAQFRIHYHRVKRKGESVKEMDDDFFLSSPSYGKLGIAVVFGSLLRL